MTGIKSFRYSNACRVSAFALAVYSTLSGLPANAQDVQRTADANAASGSEGSEVPPIVVTARRRSETLQSVPVTVSAFGQAQFQRLAVSDVTDLSGKSPNVQIVKTGAGTGSLQVFIRGIGQDALAFNVENPVGIYLDDVYLGRVQGALLDMLDFERVEILRGPQGTLYGRNSTVGALKYVTKQPDLETAHYRGSVTLGNFRRADALVSASIPVIEGVLAVKLDVGTRNQQGYMDIVDVSGHRTGQHLNGADRQNARLAIRWKASDRLTIDLAGDYGIDRSGSTIGTPVVCADPVAGPCGNAFGSPYLAGDNGAGLGRNDAGGVSARAAYVTDLVTLKSISSYRWTKNLDSIDLTNLPGAGLLIPDHKDQHQFSQELQAATNGTGPFSLVAGLFFFNENIRHDDTFIGIVQHSDHQNADSYAAYAELNYKILPRLSLTAGGRYSFDHKSISRTIFSGDRSSILYQGSGSFSTRKFTYKLGADYHLTQNALAYLTYSTGYRPGGYVWTYPTQAQIDANVVLSTTNTESSRNLEAGGKFQLFDHRLTLDIAGFLTKYIDLQAQSTTVPFPVLSKDVDIKGVELEFDARPTNHLSLYGSLGYLHSRISKGIGEGLSQRYTPKIQASLGGEYRTPVSPKAEIFLGGNLSYTSKFRTDDSFIASVLQPAYTLVGAQIGVDFDGDKYRLSIDGKNLTDKVYFLSTNPGAARWFASPRTVAATFSVRL